ncbi:MAG: type II toxin-antitoxin system RelE/ParE family toxin [Proteobacteria bacterium]|nr:type II toxin-antitoxin system RelE/ParE family toxin [Pseudomonadota bacterium]
MEIFYKPPFRKFVKKQTRSFQLVIEDEVDEIAISPDMGESKKGDLTGFRVHKFSYGKQKFLIAYRFKEAAIVFFMIGAHENFYRELKSYLREAG